MIGMIGGQRFLIILVLLVLAIGLGFANFQYLRPQADATQRDLSAAKSEESRLRTEIESMRGNMETFKRQQVLFDLIQKDGFFNLQDRVTARENLNALQSETKIVTLKYEIKSASMSLPEGIFDDKYAVLTSPLSIQIDALDDVDIYNFIGLLTYTFPGIVNVKSINIKAQTPLTTDVLRRIKSGEAPVLVTANISADWITLAPWGTAPWASSVDPALLKPEGAQ